LPELSNARPVAAESAAGTVMCAAGRDLAEAIVSGVGDVDVACGIHGQACGRLQGRWQALVTRESRGAGSGKQC
jgi:hypothetical protein